MGDAGAETVGPLGSPGRNSLTRASSSRPQPRPFPGVYETCKVGKLGTSAQAEGGLEAVKALNRGWPAEI